MIVSSRMVKPHMVKKWARPATGFLQELALTGHLRQLGPDPGRGVLEPTLVGLPRLHQTEEEEEPASGYGEGENGHGQADGDPDGHVSS